MKLRQGQVKTITEVAMMKRELECKQFCRGLIPETPIQSGK